MLLDSHDYLFFLSHASQTSELLWDVEKIIYVPWSKWRAALMESCL